MLFKRWCSRTDSRELQWVPYNLNLQALREIEKRSSYREFEANNQKSHKGMGGMQVYANFTLRAARDMQQSLIRLHIVFELD